jgi:2,4-dienoyl-CoA reductase-like NADH-dependent reductase (Old Yellow Enzyme family)
MAVYRSLHIGGRMSLFSPYHIRGMKLANRFIMPAMQRGFCRDGAPTAELADYYRRRIEGGTALIIAESCAVDHPSATRQPGAGWLTAATAAAWKNCVDSVKEAGGAMLMQLWHEGAIRNAEDGLALSPSGLAHKGRANGRAASMQELIEIRDAFIASAVQARSIGADGVEVHACHGYLLDQFMWAETNRREDGYGGPDILARARLPLEIIAGIRAACGEDFVISLRLSQWKEVNYHAEVFADESDLARFCTAAKTSGCDLLHMSVRRFWEPAFAGHSRTLASLTREMSGLAVITVGSVGLNTDVMTALMEKVQHESRVSQSIELLETQMAAGDFDLVAVGRGLIGDPDWVNKVRAQRYEDIRTFERDDLGALSWDLDIVHEAHGHNN